MKCTIPEISWHNRGPVLSVDLQAGCWKNSSGETFWRLASGGTDSHVLIWHVTVNEAGESTVSCVSDLERHQKTVNVVRFSPSGEILASGDDESIIVLWKQQETSEILIISGDDIVNKERWNSLKVLRGHIEDVYDLSWSPNSGFIASASLDNTVILWNVEKGKKIAMCSDYNKGFPQGVAWDPVSKYVASLSSDRICRLIDVNLKKTVQRVSKSRIPTPAGHALEGRVVRLFYDDTFKSYFRRLTFTPDGSLIIAPSGIIEPQESTEKVSNGTIVFSRHSLKEPVAILPSYEEVTNAARCCPVYFKLRNDGPMPMIDLPYRMVFAVATDNSVIVYDTQQTSPIAIISNIHYTRLTDITWSSDGRLLVASSSDGYCSIIHFQVGELGEIYEMAPKEVATKKSDVEDIKEKLKSTSTPFIELDANAVDMYILQKNSESIQKDETKPATSKENSDKVEVDDRAKVENKPTRKLNTLEGEIRKNSSNFDETEDFQLILEDTIAESEKPNVKTTPSKNEKTSTTVLARTPRRVQLITLSSPRRAKPSE
ncbi:chromatin assembly factor 1 subunit B [Phymastichus coffea]|uniref:chromatin assembly factor 1 subunit B n=1 Tax=Phymastichus coffea TaxID=108790 RepID=UPI00273BC588|nr:chromatin assembly factor 1 subunit B [Phymastichus coffea]